MRTDVLSSADATAATPGIDCAACKDITASCLLEAEAYDFLTNELKDFLHAGLNNMRQIHLIVFLLGIASDAMYLERLIRSSILNKRTSEL